MAKITEKQAYEYLHRCRYCDEYTGNDETGCAGRPTPCHDVLLGMRINCPTIAYLGRWST